MKISILTPTRGRPVLAKGMLDSMMRTADQPDELEALFYVDSDDSLAAEYRETLEGAYQGVVVMVGEPMSVSKSWNILAGACTGELLSMGNDDLVYKTHGWDTAIRQAASSYADGIFCVWVRDGINTEKHCAFPTVSRRWYEALGYFTPGIFEFGYNDTWIYALAKKVERTHYIEGHLVQHNHGTRGGPARDETFWRNRRNGQWARDGVLWKQTDSQRNEDANKLLAVMEAI